MRSGRVGCRLWSLISRALDAPVAVEEAAEELGPDEGRDRGPVLHQGRPRPPPAPVCTTDPEGCAAGLAGVVVGVRLAAQGPMTSSS